MGNHATQQQSDSPSNHPSSKWPSPKTAGAFLYAIATLGVATAALWLSIVNYSQANSAPEVVPYPPKLIRMFAQPASGTTHAFLGIVLQPTYTLMRTTSRTALLSDFMLEVTKPDGAKVDPRDIEWLQEGTVVPSSTLNLNQDPAPFTVTPTNSQTLFLFFAIADPVQILPGHWEFHLKAQVAGLNPVEMPFCVNVDDKWQNFINRSHFGSPIIPILRKDLALRADPSSCYRGAF